MSTTLSVISLLVSVSLPILLWLGRKWAVAYVEKGVQHDFDRKLEALRSELRDREGEISALRNTVLTGSAGRQSLLDKRRFEAVEKIWTSVQDLGQLKMLSGMMATVKFERLSNEIDDPKIKKLVEMFGAGAPSVDHFKLNVARAEQPFIPPLAWAYYEAYRSILYGNYARYSVLKIGIKDGHEIISNDRQKTILKAALPHQAKFIDEVPPNAHHYLLDEIESLLLIELRKVLDGAEFDQASAEKAKTLMDAVNNARNDQLKSDVGTRRPQIVDDP